jgi:tetratricopeptide (TPR) repeat protein
MKRLIPLLFALLLVSCVTGKNKNAAYWNNEGYMNMKAGNLERAEKQFRKAIKLEPDNARGYNNLGRVYFRKEEHKEAVVYFKKALEIRPDALGAYSNLIESYMKLGQFEEVIKTALYVLEMDAHESQVRFVRFNLGVAYLNTGDIKAAIKEYQVLRSHDPVLASELYDLIPREALTGEQAPP